MGSRVGGSGKARRASSSVEVNSLAVMTELKGALRKRRESKGVAADEELSSWGRAGLAEIIRVE